MIEQINKTYEYLPRFENEDNRTLVVYSDIDTFRFKLVVYIGESRHTAQHLIYNEDIDNAKFDLEDFIISELCKELRGLLSN